MEFRNKIKTVYYLITDQEVYRTDQILHQLDEWIKAFRSGQWIRTEGTDEESLDEYQAHLEQVVLETQRLTQEENHDF